MVLMFMIICFDGGGTRNKKRVDFIFLESQQIIGKGTVVHSFFPDRYIWMFYN
jgi:hypothetical protein